MASTIAPDITVTSQSAWYPRSTLQVMINDTNATKLPDEWKELENYFQYSRTLFTIFLVILVIAVVGNLLVLLLFVRFSYLRTVSNSFLLSLTMADLLMSLTGILRTIVYNLSPRTVWSGPTASCILGRVLLEVGRTSSPWSLLAMTADRYLSIHLPFRYDRVVSRKFAAVVITLLWILSILLSLSPAINAAINRGSARATTCGGILLYTMPVQLVRLFLGLLAPCMAVIVIYLLIVRTARRQAMNMQKQENTSEKAQWNRNARVVTKAAVVYLILCLVFICGWLPYAISRTMYFLCNSCDPLILSYISSTSYTIALSSCAVNPWLHTMRNRVFRTACRTMCCSWYVKKRAVSPDYNMHPTGTT